MIDFKKEIAGMLALQITEMNENEIMDMIEIPPDSKMGDYAFPCFKLAKIFRKAPPLIAKEIVEKIKDEDLLKEVVNTNAYVNFFINPALFIKSVLEDVHQQGDDYGKTNIGENRKVIVEYSSVNIAKPFHIGHIRSTVIGSALNNIYQFLGYDTVAINHLGDYGTQFGKLIVAYKLWGNKKAIEDDPIPELLKIYVQYHEEAEKNPDLDEEARGWFTKLENGDEEAVELWQWFRDVSLKEFNRVYDMLGIQFDSYAGESFYSDKMPKVLETMRENGIMKKSDGAEIVDLEEFGMPPALITKKDGSTLYITRDLAAAIYRKEHYDFYKNIYVVGSQQILHFQQWMKIIELMGYDWSDDCIHVPFGMVSLGEGTMSTRHGRVVFLEDVLKKAVEKTKEVILEKNVNAELVDEVSRQVGIGAVIFQELSNNRIKDYTFSWEKTLSFEGETGPYVQYTHARACSVLRNAQQELGIDVNYDLLVGESAFELVKEFYDFPKVVLDAAEKYEPSVVTRHIIDIAQAFNRFYHEHHIIVDDAEVQKSRLLIAHATKQVIANGLRLLGIEAPERM
ncbi:MAG: arginine--tRNA ligase [Clostridia bacterium]|nr:arginine--tRNA ligase [Clostridia bacterium]